MPAVLYEKHQDGRVAVVSLNRPEVLNAYDVEMRDALYETLLAVRDDPEVRVMLLRGNGRAFCTGGDLREFGSAPSPVVARQTRWRRDVWGTLWSLPKLTIAAVHGSVVGGGFEMALLCDQCFASTEARFSLPETGLGMIPGVAGTQTLPRTIGVARAMRLVLAGSSLTALEARRLGIVNRILPSVRFRASALSEARRLARLSPRLVSALKRTVARGLDLPLEQGLRLERAQDLTFPTDVGNRSCSPSLKGGRGRGGRSLPRATGEG
jgi:enoyl-CoA hydratase/carnithine racemase